MLSELINNISSYDSNIMLAAVISLLVVILFVLLLHIYAKWFLEQAIHRHTITSSRSSSVSVSHHHVLRPPRLSSSSSTKGIDPSSISSIPLFVYRVEEEEENKGLECVICLSFFEENEVGRTFTKCGHCFHVQCIDMWLYSHSNCPICRAPAIIKCIEPAPEIGLGSSDVRGSTVQEMTNSENHENGNNNNVVINCDSPSSSSSSVLGCSVKRLLSRSTSERKVFPSTNNGPEMSV